MKTHIVRWMVLGAVSNSLWLCAGCGEGRATAETPVFTATAPAPAITEDNKAPVAAPATSPVPTDTPAAPPPVVALERTNAPSSPTNAAKPARVVQGITTPSNLQVSPALQEILKLAQAGVSDEVMLAYITNSANVFNIGPDEIVYLNDLGVSPNVVTTLIQHDSSPDAMARKQAAGSVKPLPPGVALTTPATNVYPPKAVMTPPAPPQPNLATDAVVPPPTDGQVVTTPPAQQVTVNYFYDTLTPYGNWVDVEGYGRCWQPTVAVSNPNWRPYADNGCWLWSDAGWYWHSYYSWGWAPFHYGRWCTYPNTGWLWVPDNCWGPSWVSWRYNTYHCGWAPLPPSCSYVSGVGLYYRNSSVSIGFDFGLAASCYTYIPVNRFCERNPHHYYLSSSHATAVHKDSTTINNYVVGNNNTIINQGIGRERVAKVTRAEIPHVKIREVPLPKDQHARAERIEKSGSTLLVSSPQLPKNTATPTSAFRSPSDAKPTPLLMGRQAAVAEGNKNASAPARPTVGRPQVVSALPVVPATSPDMAKPAGSGVAPPVKTTVVKSVGETGRGTQRAVPAAVAPNGVVVAKAPTTANFSVANPTPGRAPVPANPPPQNNSAQPDRIYRVPSAQSAPPPSAVGRPAPARVQSSAPIYSAPPVRSEAHYAPTPARRAEAPASAPPTRSAPVASAPARSEAPTRSAPPPSSSNNKTGREASK